MRALALALILILTACQQDPPAQGARDPSAPLTPEGYGDMTIGMSLADARRVSGQPMNNEALEPEIPGACVEQEYRTADGEQLWLMFEGDVITRITASSKAPHTRTAQNIGFGSTDAEVRAAYQNVIEERRPLQSGARAQSHRLDCAGSKRLALRSERGRHRLRRPRWRPLDPLHGRLCLAGWALRSHAENRLRKRLGGVLFMRRGRVGRRPCGGSQFSSPLR